MSDKNNHQIEAKVLKKGVVQVISENLNKHGEIKGHDKKETKNLKAMCMHHKISKKGRVKPTIINHGDGRITCTMCDHEFPAPTYSDQELETAVSDFQKLLDHAKFMAVAADFGKDTSNYLAFLSVQVNNFSKTYRKMKKVAEKAENIKKKKNGKGSNSGSQQYGSWK